LNEQAELGRADWWLEIECSPERTLSFHGAMLQGPDFGNPEQRVDFAMRRVCHLLVDQIDSRGLQELCQTLVEIYEYYRPKEGYKSIPSGSRIFDSRSNVIRGILPSAEERPFQISED